MIYRTVLAPNDDFFGTKIGINSKSNLALRYVGASDKERIYLQLILAILYV